MTRVLQAEKSLENHKSEIKKCLGLYSFDYSTVSGMEYLVEVKQKQSVPGSWTKISATKQVHKASMIFFKKKSKFTFPSLKVCRYRTPFITEALPKLQYLRECLMAECKKAWNVFLEEFNSHFQHFRSDLCIRLCILKFL